MEWLDIPYASGSAAQQLDIYVPDAGEAPFPVLVRIHGGAFAFGDKRDAQFLPFLGGVERGYGVVSVNYRLSGEALFPAAVDDVKAAIHWLRANGARYRLDASRIAVCSESAGGNLAATLWATDKVQAAVDWFGPIDFSTMDEQRAANGLEPGDPGPGLGAGPEDSPEAQYLGAPIAEVPDLVRAADPTTYIHLGLPPILIQHGRVDPLVPVQQSIEFARAIGERAGADRYELDILEGAGHGGPEFESEANLGRVFAFLDRHLR